MLREALLQATATHRRLQVRHQQSPKVHPSLDSLILATFLPIVTSGYGIENYLQTHGKRNRGT